MTLSISSPIRYFLAISCFAVLFTCASGTVSAQPVVATGTPLVLPPSYGTGIKFGGLGYPVGYGGLGWPGYGYGYGYGLPAYGYAGWGGPGYGYGYPRWGWGRWGFGRWGYGRWGSPYGYGFVNARALYGNSLASYRPLDDSPSPNFSLDSYRGMVRGVHPASWAQRRLLENSLKRVELTDSRRADRILRLQEWDLRQDIARLYEEEGDVNAIVAGSPNYHQLRGFYMLAMKYADDELVYSCLNNPAGEADAKDFGFNSRVYDIVQEDGELARLPHLLAQSELCLEDEDILRQAWGQVWNETISGSPVSYQSATELSNAAKLFYQSAMAVIDSEKKSVATHAARKYAQAVKALAERVFDEELITRVVEINENGGAGFQGGTVRDLLTHILNNQLSIKQGSTAQFELQDLAGLLKKNIDRQLTENKTELEDLKKQHHWTGWAGPWDKAYGGERVQQTSAASQGGALQGPLGGISQDGLMMQGIPQ